MDPLDLLDAKQIVIEYATILERDVAENRHPARVDSLPYAKPIIKRAIQTSAVALNESGQMTDDMREYFEAAYTMLAEYLDSELVELVAQYRASAERLTSEAPTDRIKTTAWRTVVESSALAGEIARATAHDTETLRAEFRSFVAAS